MESKQKYANKEEKSDHWGKFHPLEFCGYRNKQEWQTWI